MEQQKIKVLIVEDSVVTQELLVHILGSDPSLKVIGTARDGAEAIAANAKQKPDVVTMDVQMPTMNGYEATRAIMASHPVPIVVISGQIDAADVSTTCQALGAGALMALPKPFGPSHPNYDARARELVSAVKLMAEVKVVRRSASYTPALRTPLEVRNQLPRKQVQAIGIGASTGGPGVLEKILKTLPVDFPAPIFVVQHMAEGFIQGLAEWLDRSCLMRAKLAAQREIALPGHVYVAPDRYQLTVDSEGRIRLSTEKDLSGFCPAVTPMLRSLAEGYGDKAVGILLTGMGSDGVAGLQQMREAGALTIVQDELSCVVFGMPSEAIKAGAAKHIMNPAQIAEILLITTAREG